MSYETTYFPPTPSMARDSFALNADPRNFYASVDDSLTVDTTGAKQPQDRMRLKRILNNNNGSQEQIHGQDGCDDSSPHHHHQYYQDQASPAFQTFHSSATGSVPVSTFPVSPVASLSPMTPSDGSPVPAGMAPTLATMAPFPGMNQSNLIFEEATMPYSYNMGSYNNGAAQAYSFNNKHAGHVRAMDQPEYGAESQQEYTGHHYGHNNTSSQSPDPSTGSSPTVLSSYPQQQQQSQQQQQQQRAMTNSLVDHPYPVSGSPPSTFYSQHAHFQPSSGASYSVGSQSPDFSNGYYNSAAAVAAVYGTDTFSPTPPTTPHYGFTYTMDGRYPGGATAGSVPMMYDHNNTGFTLQSQPPAPRTGSTSSKRSSAAAARAASRKNNPYEPRGSKSSDSMSIGSNGGVSTPAPTRRFQCHECEKAFPTKGELASHSRCHLKVPAFLCGICGRPFKRRTDYVRHVRNVHEEVGRYGCAQCGERFGRLDKLKRHDKRGCGNDDHDDDED